MDTDASVRALAPSSVWGGSRESLPLSVLSGNYAESSSGAALHNPTRPGLASAERASIYSNNTNNQGVAASALASERNSYYSSQHKPLATPTTATANSNVNGSNARDIAAADAKSLRSITNLDARSAQFDARSVNGDAKSVDVVSLRNYEGE